MEYLVPITRNGSPLISTAEAVAAYEPRLTPSTVFNFTTATMPKAVAAFNKVAANTDDAKVLFIGDSTTFGAWSAAGTTVHENAKANAVPALLADALKPYLPTSINNQAGDYATNDMTAFAAIDPTVTTSGWVAAPGTTVGGFILSAKINGSTLTITPTEPWDRFEITTITAPTSTGLYLGELKVDGPDGQTTTLECQAGTTNAVQTITITRTTPGLGSIVLTAITNPAVYGTGTEEAVYAPAWIFKNTQKRAVHFINAGIRGGNLGTSNVIPLGWNRVGGGQPWITRNAIQGIWAPALSVINLGINDFRAGGRAPGVAQFKIDYQAIIDQCKISGDVILVVPNDVSDADEGTVNSSAYATAIMELAKTNNLPWINIRTTLGEYAAANSAGYMADGLHPSKAGYKRISSASEYMFKELAKAGLPKSVNEIGDIKQSVSPGAPWLPTDGTTRLIATYPLLYGKGLTAVTPSVTSVLGSPMTQSHSGISSGPASTKTVYYNNTWFELRQGYMAYSSNDGSTWTGGYPSSTYNPPTIGAGGYTPVHLSLANGYMFASGYGGFVYTTSGTTTASWSQGNLNNDAYQWGQVIYLNGTYVALARAANVYSKSTTLPGTWSGVSTLPNFTGFEKCVVLNGYAYIVGGGSNILRTADFVTFTTVHSNSWGYTDLGISDNTLVAIDVMGNYMRSTDGVTWSSYVFLLSGSSPQIVGLPGGFFLVAAQNGNMVKSLNGGVTWSSHAHGGTAAPTSLTMAGDGSTKILVPGYQYSTKHIATRNPVTSFYLPTKPTTDGVPYWIYGDPQ